MYRRPEWPFDVQTNIISLDFEYFHRHIFHVIYTECKFFLVSRPQYRNFQDSLTNGALASGLGRSNCLFPLILNIFIDIFVISFIQSANFYSSSGGFTTEVFDILQAPTPMEHQPEFKFIPSQTIQRKRRICYYYS